MSSDKLNGAMQGIVAESGRSLGAGMKDGEGKDEKGVSELFKLNQVYYGLPPTLSIVSKRTLLANYGQRMTYTNPYSDVITFIFNTGEFYVSMNTSYLYFTIGYSDYTNFESAKALIAQGNAMSLFEEVVLMSASGTEICREQNKGLNAAFTYHYRHNREYIDTIGQLQGAPYGSYSALHDGVGPIFVDSLGGDPYYNAKNFPTLGGVEGLIQPRSGAAAKNAFGVGCTNINQSASDPQGTYYTRFCIPMTQVLGCFDTYLTALFPAGALAGARLEMRLKNPTESLQFIDGCVESSTGTTVSTNLTKLWNARENGLVISQIYMVLDAFQLQDNVLKRLNRIAASESGLNVLFDTYDHSVLQVDGIGVVEAPIQQARSRISASWVVVRDSNNIMNPYVNSLCAEAAITRTCASGCQRDYIPPASAPIYTNDGKNLVNTTNWGKTLQSWQVSTPIALQTPSNTYTAWPTTTTDAVQVALLSTRIPGTPTSPDYSQQIPTVSSYQTQIGSLFYPQAPLTNTAEYYQNACYIFGNSIPNDQKNASVSYQDFLGGLGLGLYSTSGNGATPVNPTANDSFGMWIAPYGLAVYGVTAEKSQKTQLSGLPLTNARLLRHKFTFSRPTLSGGSRTLNIFTEYVKVIKVFLGGRIVARE